MAKKTPLVKENNRFPVNHVEFSSPAKSDSPLYNCSPLFPFPL